MIYPPAACDRYLPLPVALAAYSARSALAKTAIGWSGDAADACCDMHYPADSDVEGARNGIHDPLRPEGGFGRRGSRKKDDEFIATEPAGTVVFACGADQLPPDRLEQRRLRHDRKRR